MSKDSEIALGAFGAEMPMTYAKRVSYADCARGCIKSMLAQQADAEIARLKERLKRLEGWLREILAAVHGDGGDYVAENGFDQAVDDGKTRVCEERARMRELEKDAARWRFLMTEPDGFDISVLEYDDDGDEQWVGCYPSADLQEKIDEAIDKAMEAGKEAGG